jgi:hypothetical protein
MASFWEHPRLGNVLRDSDEVVDPTVEHLPDPHLQSILQPETGGET